MSIRRRALAAAIAVVAVATPPAHAYNQIFDQTVACPDFGVPACTVRLFHRATSWEMFDCTGSPGAYTSCDVTHYCEANLDGGPFVVVLTTCDFATNQTTNCLPLNVACDIVAWGVVTMVPGQCVDFGASVFAATMAGFVLNEPPTTISDSIATCMTAAGPVAG